MNSIHDNHASASTGIALAAPGAAPSVSGRRGHRRALLPAVVLLATVFASSLASANSRAGCSASQLHGRYVFTASGFTRAPASPPGTPWVPKAILEVLQFNGDGTVLTPAVTVANPFGDLGSIMQPPGGAPGEYTVNADCTGTVHFLDPNNVTFTIHVDAFGRVVHMIQTNPSNNVFQGTARRSW